MSVLVAYAVIATVTRAVLQPLLPLHALLIFNGAITVAVLRLRLLLPLLPGLQRAVAVAGAVLQLIPLLHALLVCHGAVAVL